MSPFKYRLQKVFELRERKKQEQERRVQHALALVRKIQQQRDAKMQERIAVVRHMQRVDPTMFEFHDRYLQKLDQELQMITSELHQAEAELATERQRLLQAQAELEALIKHKDKATEIWREEQKQQEMKKLDEVANQRYFRQQQERDLEQNLLQ
ncbi:MAG: flagellar FliJ family protein [Vampirovibrionales bacterium]|nr:flagellar FliJ family protein [Vampirovibrionales bacterium]